MMKRFLVFAVVCFAVVFSVAQAETKSASAKPSSNALKNIMNTLGSSGITQIPEDMKILSKAFGQIMEIIENDLIPTFHELLRQIQGYIKSPEVAKCLSILFPFK